MSSTEEEKYTFNYEEFRIELQITGGSPSFGISPGKLSSSADIIIICYQKGSGNEIWRKQWEGFFCPNFRDERKEMVKFSGDYVYLALENTIIKISLAAGEIVWKCAVGTQKIRYFHIISSFDMLVVLKENREENSDMGNITAINFNGNKLWDAEDFCFNKEQDTYIDIYIENKVVHAYSWVGYEHIINPFTGEIIESKFAK